MPNFEVKENKAASQKILTNKFSLESEKNFSKALLLCKSFSELFNFHFIVNFHKMEGRNLNNYYQRAQESGFLTRQQQTTN